MTDGERGGTPGRQPSQKPRQSGRGGRPEAGRGRPEPGRDRDRGRPRDSERRATVASPRVGSPSRSAQQGPELPEGATPDALDPAVRATLRALPPWTADRVAAHLVAAGLLLDDEPDQAYVHAAEARRLAARVAAVREAMGVAAYATGRWAEARSELRAYRRLTGDDAYLPVLADCERGLGHPERALEIAGSTDGVRLDQEGQVELRIVAAGARRDLGQLDAAVVTLQCPELRDEDAPWAGRLRYAYADALLAAGRREEAMSWFARAAEADPEELTDAADRWHELTTGTSGPAEPA